MWSGVCKRWDAATMFLGGQREPRCPRPAFHAVYARHSTLSTPGITDEPATRLKERSASTLWANAATGSRGERNTLAVDCHWRGNERNGVWQSLSLYIEHERGDCNSTQFTKLLVQPQVGLIALTLDSISYHVARFFPVKYELSNRDAPPNCQLEVPTMLSSVPYTAPRWAAATLRNAPAHKLRLGHFPTPIFPFEPPGLPEGVKLFIKRDDFSGLETSGNKMRKLEFIFEDVVAQKADCIVTCGGLQSNHCRATALTARMLGLDSYLLLRTNKPDEDPGLVGNVLFNRLIDAKMILMSRQEYGRYGSQAMIEKTCERLRAQNRRPYAIPVGGSNGLGTWGYLEAVNEIHAQLQDAQLEITDLAFACGSGGTATGLGVGAYLHATHETTKSSTPSLRFENDGLTKCPVHAYIVCDNDEYFYNFIDTKILSEMGAPATLSSRKFLQITNAQGTGYARSTAAELAFITSVARKTGVVMDPVYSGKALYHLIRELNEAPEKFVGRSILFVHTGGQFGLYDKVDQLQSTCDENPVERFVME